MVADSEKGAGLFGEPMLTVKIYHFLLVLLWIALDLLVASCNDSNFAGGGRRRSEPPKTQPTTPTNQETVRAEDNLDWVWQCQTADDQAGKSASTKGNVVLGQGPHFINVPGTAPIDLLINGKLCQPSLGLRDIFFAVDVSNSMTGQQSGSPAADPLEAGVCGRYTAINQVLDSLVADGAKVALATFSGGLEVSSNGFIRVSDFKSRFATTEILCAGESATNYQAALEEAVKQFKAARKKATREIYFISDGRPNGGKEGASEASELKGALKVNIATIYLYQEYDADHEQVLQASVASLDASGKPLHRRAEGAAQLSEILKAISNAKITKGSFYYKGSNETKWTSQPISFKDAEMKFEINIDGITKEKFPGGIDIRFDYQDEAGRTYQDDGRLVWVAD